MADNLQEKKEDILLIHFHSLAQLRDKVNEFAKILELEMKRVKGEIVRMNGSNSHFNDEHSKY